MESLIVYSRYKLIHSQIARAFKFVSIKLSHCLFLTSEKSNAQRMKNKKSEKEIQPRVDVDDKKGNWN